MKTLFLAAAAVSLTATPAFADIKAGPTANVSFADLNLASVEGQKALDARIDSTARKICKVDQIRTGTRLTSPKARACYNKARASAKKQVASAIANHQLGG